ncbi:CD209 antigen-like protein C isoform X2 [Silurus meridionalis]|uniref:C-type lectin domain-containing protein n=2 Tax=Silurus meridionalis TaxID=175797 RepID=A0A8T0A598_SILME|nr:CD209 antigen-like protein C isoform X2 [Silurus meridionalis]KAF7686735.1 hypothetical protein HF521_015128 [Silurus meridionalis]
MFKPESDPRSEIEQLNIKNNSNDYSRMWYGLNTAGGRCYRVTAVCVLLLCVLLLIAVTVLWVKFINLSIEKDQLKTSYNNLILNRDQLQTSYNSLTLERDQLQTRYNNLTLNRDQLQTRYNNLTLNRDQLQTRYNNLTLDRDQLQTRYNNLSAERDQCQYSSMKDKELVKEGWRVFGTSAYHISTEKKSWAESRQYCREKGADLVIIKSRENQEFIIQQIGKDYQLWIGLSDIETEGKWKWVDGTELTSGTGFWYNGEPSNSGNNEHCAEMWKFPDKMAWNDRPCSEQSKWICEKNLL